MESTVKVRVNESELEVTDYMNLSKMALKPKKGFAMSQNFRFNVLLILQCGRHKHLWREELCQRRSNDISYEEVYSFLRDGMEAIIKGFEYIWRMKKSKMGRRNEKIEDSVGKIYFLLEMLDSGSLCCSRTGGRIYNESENIDYLHSRVSKWLFKGKNGIIYFYKL